MRLLPLLLVAMLLASCSGKKEETKKPEASSEENVFYDAKPLDTFAMTGAQMENPTNAIVSVDGRILRLGDLNMETKFRFQRVDTSKLSQETLTQMRSAVIEQYIVHALLLNEAKNREITATDEDLQAEYKIIMKQLEATQPLPPGTTMEDVLGASPLGREKMIDQIKNQIAINKLNAAIVKDKVNVSDKEIDEFIEQNRAQLTLPERVEARHILIAFEPGDDEKAKQEKKKKLENIRAEILDGADFAEMAKAHSDCGSADVGGYLGKFDRNSNLVPEFKDAAFAQKVGKVGKVITTQFGYHIILVEKHEKEGLYPREQIKNQIMNVKAQGVWTEYMKQLREKADIKYFNS